LTKTAKFKQYSGGNNYAAFRYGVNLKDIVRNTESKQIATKLIVKDNSNELADGGVCSISKAPSNMTGENYIYDF
jgi:phage minor structural protein